MFVPKTGISLMTHTDRHHSESITLDFTVKTLDLIAKSMNIT